MFAYCLNNPVNGCDPCGTCFHRWDVWNDCEECGGKTIGDKWDVFSASVSNAWDATIEWCADAYNTYNYAYQQQVEMQAQITRTQTKMIASAAETAWDAYMRGYDVQQTTQREETQMVMNLFSTPETSAKTLGVVGAELVFIGCFWGGQLLNPIGSGLLFIAAVVAFA